MTVLVTGGARSGKSRFAEARLAALAPAGPWRYVATAEPGDDEMRARIARHQARRGAGWSTVEAPRAVADVVRAEDVPTLIDCVTVWLSNLMLDGRSDEEIVAASAELAERARASRLPVVVVTNEVGLGIVPESALGRRFRDVAGLVNQRLAAASDEVHQVVAGLPLRLR